MLLTLCRGTGKDKVLKLSSCPLQREHVSSTLWACFPRLWYPKQQYSSA